MDIWLANFSFEIIHTSLRSTEFAKFKCKVNY